MPSTLETNTADIIAKARDAADTGLWKNMGVLGRGIYLKKIADLIRKNAKELAEIEAKDTGKTIKHTTFIDIPSAADTFDFFGKLDNVLADRINPVKEPVESISRREPFGVVGCIFPWNYPLLFAAWKAAPAMVAGNCVILKASPSAHASVMRFRELLAELNLPAGVINILPATDDQAAIDLIESPDVDMISFTGGNTVGEKVMQAAARSTKKVTLELGGKSPNIVFADCNQEAALGGTLSAIFLNQGQMCTAGSRLFIEETIHDDFLSKLIEKTKALKIGDPLDYETQFGPLVSVSHRDMVLECIRKAESDGAKVLCGGKIPEGFSEGAYIEPTILSNVTEGMSCTEEEVFGPVLTVQKFRSEDEVIRSANNTKYGLAASIWSEDDLKAKRVADALDCGTVWINTYGVFLNEVGFSGFKRSGFGHELGLDGVYEYTRKKHICTDQTPGGMPLVAGWF